jgi:hypothetical protein
MMQILATPYTRHRTPNNAITNSGSVSNPATKKNAPEYPTAEAVVGVFSGRGKRIGPVFSLVEKVLDYLSRS